MSRYCESCGSDNLGMKRYGRGSGVWFRKECLACHSTGPFTPHPPEQMSLGVTEPDQGAAQGIAAASRSSQGVLDGDARASGSVTPYDPRTSEIPF